MGGRPAVENMAGLNGKNIIVTGGAGFIGGHLVKKLVALGANVLVIDITIIENCIFVTSGSYKKTKFELVDVRNRSEIERVFKEFNPKFIFHLAAQALVGNGFFNPVKTFETNVMGTVNVLEAARNLKYLKGIIVASSDKAYGKLKTNSAYKEDFPLFGDHPYDVSKSCEDLIALTYFKTYQLPVAVTRFGNVYGEGDFHFNRIIPGICEALVNNKTLEIRSNGKYVRDYLYVEDVVNGYLFLLSKIDSIKGEAFNFSSNDNLSVLDVVKTVEKSLGEKIKYTIKNSAKNEIPYQHLDDSKIKKLGWSSSHSLKTSLPSVLEWYKHDFYKI